MNTTGETRTPVPGPQEIARDYGGAITALCRRMIRNRELAEDTAQEIWCELMKSLPGFRGDSKFSTWLYTLAHRTLRRAVHREKSYSTRFLSEFFRVNADDGISELEKVPVEDRLAWMKTECDACLTAIVHCLNNDDRLIYLLRVLTPLEYPEIAEITSRKEASVRQSFSRSSRRINRFLNGHCALYNPDGTCRCKMKEPMKRVDREEEYRTVRSLAGRLAFIRQAGAYHEIGNSWRQHTAQSPVA